MEIELFSTCVYTVSIPTLKACYSQNWIFVLLEVAYFSTNSFTIAIASGGICVIKRNGNAAVEANWA